MLFRASIKILGVAAVAFGLLLAVSKSDKALIAAQDGNMVARYITAPITRGDLRFTISATGSLKARLQVKVGSQVSGQISQLHVDFNDRVKRGQPIAQLDARSHEAKVSEEKAALNLAEAQVAVKRSAVAEAEAKLKRAQAQLQVVKERLSGLQARQAEAERVAVRAERLRDSGTYSQAVVDKAFTEMHSSEATLRSEQMQIEVEAAGILAAQALVMRSKGDLQDAIANVELRKARLSLAEIELSRTTIVSPIDGHIIGRNVDTGQTVATSLEAPTLFEIVKDLARMEVHLRVDEADIGQVAEGQRVEFKVDAHPGRQFKGIVEELRKAPEVVDNVVTYTVVVSAANDDYLLLPGMTATAKIIVMERTDTLRIPDAALRFRLDIQESPQKGSAANTQWPTTSSSHEGIFKAQVWTLSQLGAATPLNVQIGQSDKSYSELLSVSLKPGDRVIVGRVPQPKRKGIFGLRFGF